MARLNDPPVPPTESIDALKRRFIRQNREIARVNSTQSQRIRNLESEISRLLAENIALREQAIAAATEAEKWRTASRLGRDVLELKLRLESKLGEVNSLVDELGDLPDRAARRSSVRWRKSGFVREVAGSPNDKDWRNRERYGQEGRLPAILEDKYYPRRTLENGELRILTVAAIPGNEDSESPDLGPPPVAHFEDADPVAFDSAKSPKRVSGGIIADEDDVLSLQRNFETRRKRRTSSLLHDMSGLQEELEERDQTNGADSVQHVKSNVKRKFDASEMELSNIQVPQDDGLEFSRRGTTNNRSKPSRFTARPADRIPQNHLEPQPVSPQKDLLPRKALAPKSTNSPSKKTVTYTYEKKQDQGMEEKAPNRLGARRAAIPSTIRIELPDSENQTEASGHAPKTPAPPLEDVLSPSSSAIDTAPKSKSIEAAITNSVEDVLNGSIGRGSRRAKAAVSYAEPNLRDKMRRPDKKLVGAVEGINKGSTTSDKESGRERSSEPTNQPSASGMRIIKIKSEKQLIEDDDWKNLPEAANTKEPEEAASPLRDKRKPTQSTFAPEPRKKRTFSESEGTKLRIDSDTNTIRNENDLDKATSRLSIHDPPNSSPMSIKVDTPPSSGAAPSTTRSRRHSTQPASHTIAPSARLTSSTSMSALPMMAGKENVNLTAAASKVKRSGSVQNLTQRDKGAVTGQAQTQTVERSLGSRRRSMMV